MLRALTILVVSLACGCDSDCEAIWEVYQKDLCLVDRSADAARRGSLREAKQILEDIDGTRARGMAVEWIVTLRPPGLDRAGALELCDGLGELEAPRCRKNWDRPELWERW